MSEENSRNIEIKAKIKNFDEFIKVVKLISEEEPVVLEQEDIFFNTSSGSEQSSGGRLKLRAIKDQKSELIYYNRPDQEGPKLSLFSKVDLPDVDIKALSNVLTMACGKIGVVKKTRHLYMVGQTRVHVDQVDHLGNFMELEVCLKPDQTAEDGEKIADQLMEKLGVTKNDLISCAYVDLLKEKGLAH